VDLRNEARYRLTLKPGTEYDFPIKTVDSTEKSRRPVARYAGGTYGLVEAGGTQNIMLSGVSFELLGFRKNIPHFDLPSLTWAYIRKVLWVFGGVFAGGTSIYAFTHRQEKEVSHD
jgi:hypothetical protein